MPINLDEFAGFYQKTPIRDLVFTGFIYKQEDDGAWTFCYGVDDTDENPLEAGEDFHYRKYKTFHHAGDDIAALFPDVDLSEYNFTDMALPRQIFTVLEVVGFDLFDGIEGAPISFEELVGYPDPTDYYGLDDDLSEEEDGA